MTIITYTVGYLLVLFGLDGYFNNGDLSRFMLTPNYDIAMTMLVTGCLVLACSLCLRESRAKPVNQTDQATP